MGIALNDFPRLYCRLRGIILGRIRSVSCLSLRLISCLPTRIFISTGYAMVLETELTIDWTRWKCFCVDVSGLIVVDCLFKYDLSCCSI